MENVTTGVELELWVVDRVGQLCDGREIVDAHERIEGEFIDPLIEVATAPHETEAGLRRDLKSTLRTAINVGDAHGKRLVPLGTPLTGSDAAANCERGRLFETIYGPGVESAKNCAGTHVHFEQDDVVAQLNLLTALDPALALVSSAPYYRGKRCENSARARAYRWKCGPGFRRFCDLWNYVDSVEQWTGRVEAMYELFKEQAAESGVAAGTIDEYFAPGDTVLNPVRLRGCQPTVEWRAPDAALPSQVVQLATDVGALVARLPSTSLELGSPGIRTDCIRLPEFAELQELSRQAIDSGLDAVDVREYLRAMGFDPSQYEPRSSQLAGPSTLSESEARTLRLDQARRLRADVESLTNDRSHPRLGRQTPEA